MATKANRDLRLVVVGGGDREQDYRALTQNLHLSSNVVFAGNVPDEQLPLYYAASDALVLPSKDMSEGFGLTLLEANATGKPVIASNVGGIPSVIQDGHNGLLVPPKNPSSLADTILKLAGDSQLAKRIGQNGRKLAEPHDWGIVAARTEEVYMQALVEGKVDRR